MTAFLNRTYVCLRYLHSQKFARRQSAPKRPDVGRASTRESPRRRADSAAARRTASSSAPPPRKATSHVVPFAVFSFSLSLHPSRQRRGTSTGFAPSSLVGWLDIYLRVVYLLRPRVYVCACVWPTETRGKNVLSDEEWGVMFGTPVRDSLWRGRCLASSRSRCK